MVRHSIRLSLKFIVLLFVIGCRNTPNGGQLQQAIEPLWRQKLAIGSSSMVWSRGLITPMKYGNDVIFNTTLTYTDEIQDDRLCGLDADTGEIKWMFPADKSQSYDYYFNGRGYIYGDNLLVKSPSYGVSRLGNEILCIDLRDQSLTSSFSLPPGDNPVNDSSCYGNGQYVVWQGNWSDNSQIYKMDIETGSVEPIVSFMNDANSYKSLYAVGFCDRGLIYLEQGGGSGSHGKYLCIFDVENNELISRYKIDVDYPGYGLSWGCYDRDISYLTVGPYVLAVNMDNGEIIWKTEIGKYADDWAQHAVICGDNLFLIGFQMYMAIDKQTGKTVYKKKKEGGYWAVEHNGYVYANILEKLCVIDCGSGDILATVICPEMEENGDGFNLITEASFYGEKMYLMSYTSAYCYPVYPWKQTKIQIKI